MATNNRLSELTISFTKRNARAKGPTSSEAWNDQADELSRDLTAIYSEWNNSLIPLLSLLPGEEDGYNVDAFSDGLDGRTLFVNAESSLTDAARYYNAGQVRANTLYEQFQDVYSQIDLKVDTVQEQIDNVSLAASDIPISDAGAVYSSSTVEGALQEVMNLVARAGTDHGALLGLADDDHTQYLPRTGVRAMTGTLNMGSNTITGVTTLTANSIITSTITTGTLTLSANVIVSGSLTSAQTQSKLVKHTLSTAGGALALTDGGTIYSNAGAGSISIFTLPVAGPNSRGCIFTFVVNDTDGIRVTADAGHTINIAGVASSSAGTASCTTLGGSLTLVYVDNNISTAGRWVALCHEGTWTLA